MRKLNQLLNLRTLLVALVLMVCGGAQAVPAYSGLMQYRQADGTMVSVYLRGNHRVHYYETPDGVLLAPDSVGNLCYAQLGADGMMVACQFVAHDRNLRTVAEQSFVQRQDRVALRAAVRPMGVTDSMNNKAENSMRQPGEITRDFPTTGTVRGLVILAEFADQKFSAPDIKDTYDQLLNQPNYTGTLSTGSVRDYFEAQSGGLFTPQFDVVGPVQLPHKMKYYGETENIVALMEDACTAADHAGVDFTRYDQNGDETIDFVFVIFAGYGQSQGGDVNTVWPCKLDMYYQSWNTYDNLFLGLTACSCELHGNTGTEIDGIGTICHEFSHIFGLPDIYDIQYGSSVGMFHWDVMDVGLYNGDTRTPSGYTAMDKYTVGWLEPIVLSEAGTYTLSPLSENGEAYFLLSPDNDNEYYTLENRQLSGWDAALPGHGLIISHCYYDQGCWNRNTINTKNAFFDHVTLVPADNEASTDNEASDPYPNASLEATALSAVTTPAGFWHSGGNFSSVISNIHEDSSGNIVFDFQPISTGIATMSVSRVSLALGLGYVKVVNPEHETVSVIDTKGRTISCSSDEAQRIDVPAGVYIIKYGEKTTKVIVK